MLGEVDASHRSTPRIRSTFHGTTSIRCRPAGTGSSHRSALESACTNTLPNAAVPARTTTTILSPTTSALLSTTRSTRRGSPATQQCGRVLFIDFHAITRANNNDNLPEHCSDAGSCPGEGHRVHALRPRQLHPRRTRPPDHLHAPNLSVARANCGSTRWVRRFDGELRHVRQRSTCGGGGNPLVCGGPTCTPRACLRRLLWPHGDCAAAVSSLQLSVRASVRRRRRGEPLRSFTHGAHLPADGWSVADGDGCVATLIVRDLPPNCTPDLRTGRRELAVRLATLRWVINCGVCPPGTTRRRRHANVCGTSSQ